MLNKSKALKGYKLHSLHKGNAMPDEQPQSEKLPAGINHRPRTSSMWRSAAASVAVVVVVLAGFAGSAIAASDEQATKVDIHTVDMHKWKADSTTGWSVRNLIGKTVQSPKGENVGEVDNIVFTPEGKVRQLIVSTNGILGFGEKNLAVNWSDVTMGPGNASVSTPITAESVKKYGLFDGFAKSSGPIAPRDWRSSELIRSYVTLKGNVHYGYVRDLIVSKDGQLQAVIVSADVGYAYGEFSHAGDYYAYPFYGYGHGLGYGHHGGWNPGDQYYNLPYAQADIADLLPYVYAKQ
ncbi:MAG: PRC-barrel domain-containing protein [Opitutaceae bacterium]